MDTMEVAIAEERMLSEDGLEPIALGCKQDDMLEYAYALVTMNNINMFSY